MQKIRVTPGYFFMIKIENIETCGWNAALRGMRNPMNSWEKSDSVHIQDKGTFVGEKDLDLLKRLTAAGKSDRKVLRMIHVQMDIVAPRYWLTELDTYKIATVRNSCSTMHKITSRHLTLDDFSIDAIKRMDEFVLRVFNNTLTTINMLIDSYNEKKNQTVLRAIKELLPECFLQRITWDCNYETLLNIYFQRKGHMLPEWKEFCQKMLDELPYFKMLVEATSTQKRD